MATKAELEKEVKVLRAQVAAMEPDAVAAAHVARLNGVAESLEARLDELGSGELAVLNQIYRQIGEVQGVLRARRPGAGASPPSSVPANAPLDKVANMVRFKRGQGS